MSLQQTNAQPISNKQQLDLSTKEPNANNISQTTQQISGETVKLEVSADQAKWSELYDVEVSRYPNKKSHYVKRVSRVRYVLARQVLKEVQSQYPTDHGWKHRIKKHTFAEISVTTLVKTEILKP